MNLKLENFKKQFHLEYINFIYIECEYISFLLINLIFFKLKVYCLNCLKYKLIYIAYRFSYIIKPTY